MNPLTIAQGTGIRTIAALEAPEPDRRAQVAEAARKFEKMFAQMMVKGMRESSKVAGGDGLFGQGPGSDTYTDWFDGLMSDRLSQGSGLGLQAKLMKEWDRPTGRPADGKGNKDEVNHVVA